MNQKFSRAQFVFVFVFSFLLSAFARMCAVLFIYSTLFALDFFYTGCWAKLPLCPSQTEQNSNYIFMSGGEVTALNDVA